jgi:hypothetical protein
MNEATATAVQREGDGLVTTLQQERSIRAQGTKLFYEIVDTYNRAQTYKRGVDRMSLMDKLERSIMLLDAANHVASEQARAVIKTPDVENDNA